MTSRPAQPQITEGDTDESIRTMLTKFFEGTPFGELLSLQDQARNAAKNRQWHRSAELFAECITKSASIGQEVNGLLVQILDERAIALHRAGLNDEVKACKDHALRIRSEHLAKVLTDKGAKARTPRQRKLVRAILPKFVPFLEIGLTGGGLVYFEGAPYAVVLNAANRLGFDFFRRHVGEFSKHSYLDLLELCHPHAHETTFGGYLVPPPRKDTRLSLTSLRTPWSDRLNSLVQDVDEVQGQRSYGSLIYMSWR